MSDCEDMRALLPGLIRGELDDALAERAAAHLDACPACAEALEDVGAEVEPARAPAGEIAPPPAPAVSLAEWGRVYDGIHAAVRTGAAPRGLSLRARGRLFAVAAAILVAIGAGLFSLLSPEPRAGSGAHPSGPSVASSAPQGTVARVPAPPVRAEAVVVLEAAPSATAAPAVVAAAAPSEGVHTLAPAAHIAVPPAALAAARALLAPIHRASTDRTLEDDEDEGIGVDEAAALRTEPFPRRVR